MFGNFLNKKGMLPALFVIAGFVWFYNFYSVKKRIEEKPVTSVSKLTTKTGGETVAQLPLFDPKLRDPFKSYLTKRGKKVVKKRVVKRKIKKSEPVKLPQLILDGIMWDSKNPMAIINSNGVNVGSRIGEVVVRKILEDRVEVEYKGKKFWVK